MVAARSVNGSAAREPEAFAEWVRPHVGAMARLASRLGAGNDRDDIVQEALARAWLKRDQFDASRGSPSAWLLAITADQIRKRRRRRSMWPWAVFATAPGPPDDHLDLEHALSRLTRRERLAIECYYFVGLSILETAVVMRCAEGTVKSTLSDARAKLRRLLESAP